MSFSIRWRQEAEEQLADVWLRSSARSEVVAAVREMESHLCQWPVSQAEHLSEGLWRLEASPILAYFSVEPDLNRIIIEGIAPEGPVRF